MMDTLGHVMQFVAAGLDITNLPKASANSDTIKTILNLVLAIMGAIAVLIVVISGFRLVTSQGNPTETSKARNGIIYALIGLLVIMFALSIVNFVIFRVT
ncbi:MAG TPA: hypothetical protein VFB59_01090 [Candidatus Saccharimonadales bacterium]|nr:hypothetical protein [Candidatus Saccharimonadales bacterium]